MEDVNRYRTLIRELIHKYAQYKLARGEIRPGTGDSRASCPPNTD